MEKATRTLHIGCHLSSAGGFLAMGKEATRLNADVFAFFTRNPRGGRAKPLDLEDIRSFVSYKETHGIGLLVAHAPYTMNACAAKENLRTFARDAMIDDLARLEHIPGNFYNFHPGSHVQQGSETGIALIAELLNDVLRPEQKTTVLLETMAGKGTEVGRSFQELRSIIDKVKLNEHIGICLDTCHIWDAGYDIRNHLDDVLAEFDNIIGFDRLRAVHLNDSQNTCASHKDRHARIGEGEIGLEALVRIINHPRLCHLPFILETPNDAAGYAEEIALLRQKAVSGSGKSSA